MRIIYNIKFPNFGTHRSADDVYVDAQTQNVHPVRLFFQCSRRRASTRHLMSLYTRLPCSCMHERFSAAVWARICALVAWPRSTVVRPHAVSHLPGVLRTSAQTHAHSHKAYTLRACSPSQKLTTTRSPHASTEASTHSQYIASQRSAHTLLRPSQLVFKKLFSMCDAHTGAKLLFARTFTCYLGARLLYTDAQDCSLAHAWSLSHSNARLQL